LLRPLVVGSVAARALLDDPYILLASGWLPDRFGCLVVVVVRDPAAMLAS